MFDFSHLTNGHLCSLSTINNLTFNRLQNMLNNRFMFEVRICPTAQAAKFVEQDLVLLIYT